MRMNRVKIPRAAELPLSITARPAIVCIAQFAPTGINPVNVMKPFVFAATTS
jgi:hypothetical protein